MRIALLLLLSFVPLTVLRAEVGDLFVTANSTSTTNGMVIRIQPDGTYGTLAGSLSRPYGLAIDAVGYIYVSDITGGTITKISPTGTTTPFSSGLTTPRGLAIDPATGDLFAATGSTITRITPGGVATTFDSGFANVWDVTFDSTGTMFVDELGTRRIYRYDAFAQRSLYATLSSPGAPYGLAFNGSNDLFISEGSFHFVAKYSASGVETTFASGTSSFQPVGIDTNASGEVFVATFFDVLRYSPDGLTSTPFVSGIGFTGMMAFQTVPEPSGFALLAFGALALGAHRRGRCTRMAATIPNVSSEFPASKTTNN